MLKQLMATIDAGLLMPLLAGQGLMPDTAEFG
jgi:hypothetical protein